MGNKHLTHDELQALKGKFFLDNGYDIGDSYVCAGYLRLHCDQLEVLPFVEASEHRYPVRLHCDQLANKGIQFDYVSVSVSASLATGW